MEISLTLLQFNSNDNRIDECLEKNISVLGLLLSEILVLFLSSYTMNNRMPKAVLLADNVIINI